MRKMLRTCFQTRELTNSHGSRNREALGVEKPWGSDPTGLVMSRFPFPSQASDHA